MKNERIARNTQGRYERTENVSRKSDQSAENDKQT